MPADDEVTSPLAIGSAAAGQNGAFAREIELHGYRFEL